MPGLPETAETDPAAGADGQDCQRGVLEGDTEPGLGRELKGSTDEVSDDIGVADHHLVTVPALAGLGSVEILNSCALVESRVNITKLVTFLKAASILAPSW